MRLSLCQHSSELFLAFCRDVYCGGDTRPNTALQRTRRERLRLRLTAARQGGCNRPVPRLSRGSLDEGGMRRVSCRGGFGSLGGEHTQITCPVDPYL